MRPFTGTSGEICDLAAPCTSTCEERERSGASATAATTAEADWLESGTSASGLLRWRERNQIGHWEIDTVMGAGQKQECVVTLVERNTGYVMIGKLPSRRTEHSNKTTLALVRRHPGKFQTITADNGTEFHGYREIEAASGVKFYFATPHHAWERGTSENANGLLRQYLPRGKSMASLTQRDCDLIAEQLNNRPRKRHDYKTPNESFYNH
jgi:transposase, IS30 family